MGLGGATGARMRCGGLQRALDQGKEDCENRDGKEDF
jgi:hypothetical protein